MIFFKLQFEKLKLFKMIKNLLQIKMVQKFQSIQKNFQIIISVLTGTYFQVIISDVTQFTKKINLFTFIIKRLHFWYIKLNEKGVNDRLLESIQQIILITQLYFFEFIQLIYSIHISNSNYHFNILISMKDLPSPVINSNCDNFLTPKHSKSESHITRIQPDKFTFLKSNLLVSNILNSNPKEIDKSFIKQNKQKNISIIIGETCFNKCQRKGQIQNQQNIKQNDAYINCEVQRVRLVESSQIYYQKNQRVRNLVKYRSHKTFQQLKNQEKSLFQNIQNINLMKKQMADKAGQIMNKKQDTSYLGRNLMKQGQNFLKQLKQTNPQSKKAKIQSTRLLMKENVKKNTKAEIKNQFQDSLNYSMSRQTQSMSVGTSMLQTSFVDYVQTKNLKQKQHSDQVIAKLIKNKSYENVFLQQKRRAVWQGFSDHWKKGGEKQQAQKQLKKKINKKKVIKNKFQSTNHQILNYNDNFTRHLALKKYQTAFEETASTFKICQEV